MPELALGQASDCTNPVLDLWTAVNGILTDVYSLEFEIWENVTTPGTPIQVYPVAGGRQVVNVSTGCPAGDKLSTGRYVAKWTPDLAEPIGEHEIRWFFKLTAASSELSYTETFTVLVEVVGSAAYSSTPAGYCTVADLRALGVPDTGVGAKTDAQLQALIAQQSKMIDMFTGRFFEPRSLTLLLDGSGRRGLLLGPPIISISQIRLIATDTTDLAVDLTTIRIYNRHMAGLFDPDDRDNPRLEWLEYDRLYDNDGRWPEGTQNVEVSGVFGYTDPDGTPNGATPLPIQLACARMVLRNLYSPLDPNYADTMNAWKITELRTRDQTIKWDNPSNLGGRGIGAYTGDPEIDTILVAYTRQPQLGAA